MSDAIRGVFAYLDAVLPPAMMEDLSQRELTWKDEVMTAWDSHPRKVVESSSPTNSA